MRARLSGGAHALTCTLALAVAAFAPARAEAKAAFRLPEQGVGEQADGARPEVSHASTPSAEAPGDLSNLSIEQLANLPVRSAAKREQPLSEVPAALYVITSDDIQNSGATSLPEALRLAPNLNVQQVTASQYSISARGFNGIQAGNKLLVLIDGRSIYTPLGDSVLWELHQPLLEDVQQVEVISGPGGTLYGPNAVNGVVNVTTKSAQDTLGGFVRGTAGTGERTAAARYGFALGPSAAVRLYADWQDREGLPVAAGFDQNDSYRGWQAGFRSDFGGAADQFTVQGDLFHATDDLIAGDRASAHNLLGRWTHTISPNASFQFQSDYDWYRRDVTLVQDSLTTFENEAQLNLTAGPHQIVAGGGIRLTKDLFINGLNGFQLNPQSRRLAVYNAFAQDRFALTDKLALIAGVKFERSSFVGWQVLPNLRVAYQASPRTLLWAAVSRAVRTPSRIDRELEFEPILPPSVDFKAEKVVAVEAGYRGEPSSWLSLSVNAFYNFYTDLRTTESITPALFPVELLNGRRGNSYGIEAWAKAQVTPWWRLSLGATTLHKNFHMEDDRVDFQPRNSLGADPHWQVVGSSEMDLTPRLKLTLDVRGVGALDLEPRVPGYVEAGGQLGYDLTDRVELFVAARNLLHGTHAENGDPGNAQLAKRSIYAGTRLRF
ncbi:MAG TPA: TonB-dependent receptor [Sphingomicrobium sp.]|nr:TonB-dependent receptor [Sphingomicrobium sp.]